MRMGTAKGSIQRRLPHGVIRKGLAEFLPTGVQKCAAQRCIAMASAQRAPIYVSLDVWDEIEDMTEALRKMQEESSHTEESDEEEDS